MTDYLLMSHNRVGADEFPLTHEFLAQMLGVCRPTVTAVAGTLQKAGLINYHRGKITVIDRKGLEAASCECYKAQRSCTACSADAGLQDNHPIVFSAAHDTITSNGALLLR